MFQIVSQAFFYPIEIDFFPCIDRPVAIKVVSLATLSTGKVEMLAESILTEIEMSKRLAQASKHVVHMFDFDFHQQSGLAFLVMELGEQNLEEALKDRGRLPSVARKEIWRQLVNIAQVLHNNKIVIKLLFRFYLCKFSLLFCQVHLDIKPQNLVVFPGGKIKIVDLGIAQKAYQQGYISFMFFLTPEGCIAYNK